jgi:hypothetical protein
MRGVRFTPHVPRHVTAVTSLLTDHHVHEARRNWKPAKDDPFHVSKAICGSPEPVAT